MGRLANNFIKVDPYYKFTSYLMISLLFLAPSLHFLKLIRVSFFIPSLVFYIGFPIVVILVGVSFISLVYKFGCKVDFFECLLILMGFSSTFWTVWYRGDISDILGNVLRLTFVFLLYYTTRHHHFFWTEKLSYRAAVIGAAGVFVGVFFLYAFGVYGSYPFYIGLSSESALLLLALFLVGRGHRSLVVCCFILLLILFSGKRGVILAAFMMTGVAYFFSFRSLNAFVFGIIKLCFSASCVLVLSWGLLLTNTFSFLPEPLVNRFLIALDLSSEQSVRKLTAGRNLEVNAVFETWRREPLRFWVGSGFGANFTLKNNEIDINKSTIHISPIGLIFIYGFPLSLLFIFSILWKMIQVIWLSRFWEDTLYRAWWLTAFGLLLVSLSSFIIMQNYLLWIMLGLLSKEKLRLRNRIVC
ncbi:MAG: hypothetical protein JJT82_06510 [Legionellaceae bacterium]|nr:hypothetical protein [Legionellaceae bacterium]